MFHLLAFGIEDGKRLIKKEKKKNDMIESDIKENKHKSVKSVKAGQVL